MINVGMHRTTDLLYIAEAHRSTSVLDIIYVELCDALDNLYECLFSFLVNLMLK